MFSAHAFRLFHSTVKSSAISSHQGDTYLRNLRISGYFRRGQIEDALKVFEEMPERNVVTWNCMISGFARNHMISESRKVFDAMPTKNSVSWTALLGGYIRSGYLEQARRLFDYIPPKLRNTVCWNVMLNGYIRNGLIMKAKELFDEAPDKDVSLHNRMLSGYLQMGYVKEAYELFISMPQRDVASWTSMISCYAKTGLMKEARYMFDSMPFERDIAAWTALIKGYMQNGMVEKACQLFSAMPARDVVAWNCMIAGFIQNGKLSRALDFYGIMPRKSTVTSNSILYGFVQEGDMIGSENFFNNCMPQKDVASWNTLMSGYQTEEALALYCQMLRCGFSPDQVTYTCLISVCGALAMQGWGRAVHLCIIKTGYASDRSILTSLISMYSKCGLIQDATLLFETMEDRDTAAWNAMILAQAYHGSANKAIEFFSSMIDAKCVPSHVTFLALLTACAHWGLVDHGQIFFRSMKEWNISPKPEHYSCMVDLLGRFGLLYEAYELVKELPEDLPAYTWETLLNCCKIHGNFQLGELVAQKIPSINASNPEMHVLLSNIYAGKGLWREASNIRATMKQYDTKKEAGCSWIELGGTASKFTYNDRCHLRAEEIRREVENLSIMVEKIDTVV